MTAQIGDVIKYKGKTYSMKTEPFRQIVWKNDYDFQWKWTCNWRGYRAKWKVKDNKLYLVRIKGRLKNGKKLTVKKVFQNQETVFADWVSERIVLWDGEMLNYVHRGYCSLFERDIVLNFEKGILISEKIIDNTEDFKNGKLTEARTYRYDNGIGWEDLF